MEEQRKEHPAQAGKARGHEIRSLRGPASRHATTIAATVIKVFEDSDGDGTIASGLDEVFTTKLAVNADGDWHRRSVLWSDLELDLSGGNVSLDGQLDVEKVIRLDCTVSQMGTAQGTFGMDVDYVILTQSNPF